MVAIINRYGGNSRFVSETNGAGTRHSRDSKASRLLGSSEAVEEVAGAVEIGEEFFFGAKLAGMGDERAAGAARGMFDVKHLVVENVFDDELWNKRMIHAAVEKDLIGTRIVTAELAAPGATAPTEMGSSKRAAEKFVVKRFEHAGEVEVEASRIGGGGANA